MWQTIEQQSEQSGTSASFWNSIERETERNNKIRIDAENKIQEKKRAKKRAVIGTLICVAAVAIVICYLTVIRPKQHYQSATELFESRQYQEALEIFDSLGSYKDYLERVTACNDSIKQARY